LTTGVRQDSGSQCQTLVKGGEQLMGVVVYNRRKPSGNIFYILGQAYTVMSQEGRTEEAKKMCDRVYNSSSYELALEIISEYVELVEVK